MLSTKLLDTFMNKNELANISILDYTMYVILAFQLPLVVTKVYDNVLL